MKPKQVVWLALLAIVLVPLAALVSSRSSSAQFGAGRAGGGIPGVAHRELPYSLSESVIVVVSPGNDVVSAYSKQTGAWFKQPIDDPPQEKISPVLSREVAAFQAGERIYAFSAHHGWDSVEIEQGAESKFTVLRDMVLVEAGGRLHVFSAATGGWASTEL